MGHISVSESEMSLSDSESEDVAPAPPEKQTKPLQHPHFSGKQPKKHILPHCINVACKEEKDEKIQKLTEEAQDLKDEVRKYEIFYTFTQLRTNNDRHNATSICNASTVTLQYKHLRTKFYFDNSIRHSCISFSAM